MIEQPWAALEKVQETLEELTAFYIEVGDKSGRKTKPLKSRPETIEKEIERLIEARKL